MGMLGVMRTAKNMAFHLQYAECFTALTSFLNVPATYENNFQHQTLSTVLQIPNNRTINSPSMSDALSTESFELSDVS
jgi:hypothetical protein